MTTSRYGNASHDSPPRSETLPRTQKRESESTTQTDPQESAERTRYDNARTRQTSQTCTTNHEIPRNVRAYDTKGQIGQPSQTQLGSLAMRLHTSRRNTERAIAPDRDGLNEQDTEYAGSTDLSTNTRRTTAPNRQEEKSAADIRPGSSNTDR